MSREDQDRWNTRYRAGGYSRTVAAIVRDHAPPPAVGARALDTACGAGRNALYLAHLGYCVDAVDVSEAGLALLAAEAARQGVADQIYPIHADLDVWRPAPATYDLAIEIAFYDANLLDAVAAAMRPGGLVIVEAHNLGLRAQRIDYDPAHAMQRGALAAAFARWHILRYSDSAGAAGERSLIVARRP